MVIGTVSLITWLSDEVRNTKILILGLRGRLLKLILLRLLLLLLIILTLIWLLLWLLVTYMLLLLLRALSNLIHLADILDEYCLVVWKIAILLTTTPSDEIK